jgi:hypothetical protein
MATNIPSWKASGDWFDVCKCKIPCPCEFAQEPTFGDCEGVLAYHINKGHYGDTSLDGLNALAIGAFEGNIWAGNTKVTMGLFFDERADQKQFAKLIGEIKGIDFAPIKFDISEDLSQWSAEIPGKVLAQAVALGGPMTPPGKRVQTINPPGSEVGPGAVATWGTAVKDEVDTMSFKWKREGRSSKHIAFNWEGP